MTAASRSSGVPRAPQRRARPRQGRHPLRLDGLPRRGQGASDVDDVEVRCRERAVRRGQRRGRRRPEARSAPASCRTLRGATPPRSRRSSGRTRTSLRRTWDERPGDGVDHGHLLDAARATPSPRSSRASPWPSAAPRAARGDRARHPLHPRGAPARAGRRPRQDGGRAGVRQRRRRGGAAAATVPARTSSTSATSTSGRLPPGRRRRARRSQHVEAGGTLRRLAGRRRDDRRRGRARRAGRRARPRRRSRA